MMDRHFPIVILEIEADDLPRASAFYAGMFGWRFSEAGGQSGALEAELLEDHDTKVRVHLRQRGPGLKHLAQWEAAAQRHGHSICVRDLASVLGRVAKAGGQVIGGPVEVPGLGTRIHVRDTEGNEFAVLEPIHVVKKR